MDYTALGKKIRRARRSEQMTQEELAEELWLCTSYVGHIERGTRKISVEVLKKICMTMKMSADELLGLYGPEC